LGCEKKENSLELWTSGAAAAVFAGCKIIKLEYHLKIMHNYAYRNIENVQFITNVLAYMMLLPYIQRYKLGYIIVMHYKERDIQT